MDCANRYVCLVTGLFATMVANAPAATAAENQYEIGLRGNVLLGDGVPANDILGYGLIGRYYLNDGWFIGAALDTADFDFERPYRILGIEQDPNVKAIDAKASTVVLSASIGRQYGNTDRGFDWFWTAGLGLGFPDVENAFGPTDTGGAFLVTTDAGTEYHLMSALGSTYHFSPQWSVTAAARLEYHVMDYKVTDQVSGTTGTVDSQTPIGAYLSLNYSF